MLADLARGGARTAGKMADLARALAGRFTGHRALLCRLIWTGSPWAMTRSRPGQAIVAKAGPWDRETGLLTSVPGFGDVVAQTWMGEIGPAPHR